MQFSRFNLSFSAEPGSTILTPSALLASAVSAQLTTGNLKSGLRAWVRPEILSIHSWLTECWHTVRYLRSDTPTLLSAPQEQALWQRIIGQQYPNLFNQSGTARLAIDATRLMAEWRIPIEDEAWEDYKDAQRFHELFRRFRGLCKSNGWITCSDLWPLLPEWLENGYLHPVKVIFAGFDRFAPAADRIREALGDRSQVVSMESPDADRSVTAITCSDLNSEIERAARWSRKKLEDNPNTTVGIFVPQLTEQYIAVERNFRQIFYPARTLRFAGRGRSGGDGSEQASPFHINGAKSLRSHPLIVNALLLLELVRPQIAMADASSILRCPFIIGAGVEANERALADLELRNRRDLDVTLRQIELSTEKCPILTSIWQEIRQALGARSWTLELPRWSEFISDLLQILGWPGDGELSAGEQEVVESWKNALLNLAAVGLVSVAVTWDVAYSQLRRILASACDPEIGDWLSPIQIIDADQAAGLEFGCAALVGMSDDVWPTPERNWPLVPAKLRKACGVPGSEPQSLQEERQRRTKSLFASAPEILVTYSGRMAPVARHFVQSTAQELTAWDGSLPVHSYSPAALTSIEDTDGPPFLKEKAYGGVGIIKSQSLCPFRAFAEYRLHAQSPQDACFGIDARDRGSFLHKALELVWKDLQTLERLQQMAAEELQSLVNAAVAEAIKDRARGMFHQLTSEAERDRLETVILQWLQVEKVRKVPFTVEHVEDERHINLNGLQLKLQVDRIDRLPNGSVILIDYKTGELKAKDLEGKRPAEPQLLIYAAAIEDEVEGIYIAKARPRAPEPVGFAHTEHFAPAKATRKKTSWAQIQEESRNHLYSIAAEFVKGYAAVKPEKGACDYCDMTPLCRILEGAKVDGDEDSSD